MREMTFKMERAGLVGAGDRVHYTYMIEPAVAMSGCYKVNQRLSSREGVVKEVRHTDRGYYVIVEFEEEG